MDKMKENADDKFMGQVLIKVLELKKEEAPKKDLDEMLFKSYKSHADNFSNDFYSEARKIPLGQFWKKEFEKFQTHLKSSNSPGDKDLDVRFTAELIRKYIN